MNREVVKINDLSAGYAGQTVLDRISLSVFEHDFLGVIGPNGGGKTTLLKVILGLLQPFSGEVKVFGTNPEAARRDLGYVPQYSLFNRDFPISVWEVVLMGCLAKTPFYKRNTPEDQRLALEALATVEMLDFKDWPIGQISEGQKQRTFIARALAGRPKLLILDEPASSIDEKIQVSFYELLLKLKNQLTIIMVSHDVGVISQYVNKISCLNGRLYYHGSPEVPAEAIEASYRCPIDLIGHGKTPHRVLEEH